MDSWTRLVDIVTALEVEYVEGESAWIGSPFAWIKTRPSRQVGAIGEKIVAAILEIDGHSVARSPDSDADRVVDGHRLEIKFSTLWRNGGYKFQQIRDQNYEAAICFGVSPQEAHLWYFPKAVLYDYVIGHTGQHGGSTGQDTAWIHIDPNQPPTWAEPWGGSLDEGLAIVQRELRK